MTKSMARSSRSRFALKVISLSRFWISRALFGVLSRSTGLICTSRMSSAAPVEQRKQRRVAHIAAVPIGLAVDLDGLEQRRQAGRGHDMVGGELGAVEDL